MPVGAIGMVALRRSGVNASLCLAGSSRLTGSRVTFTAVEARSAVLCGISIAPQEGQAAS